MAKNIVLLSDGTGNSAAKLNKTNVWRLYEALDLRDPSCQIAAYDDGVGTSSFKPLAVLGGVFGVGLARNVLSLYKFVCRNYQEGDRIYGFGFSRGAFTIRIVAGLIAREGLVPWTGSEADLQRDAKAVYREFRRRFETTLRVERPFRALRDLFVSRPPAERRRPPIHFLGVWDTVAAYGGPIDEITRAIDYWLWPLSMPDRVMSAKVRRACQALALDDERRAFWPLLWVEKEVDDDGRRAGMEENWSPPTVPYPLSDIDQQRMSQVWFAGMHSDVGGGYWRDGLSYITLDWMMSRAIVYGLDLRRAEARRLRRFANPNDKSNDSRRGLGGYYRYQPRRMEMLYGDEAKPRLGQDFSRFATAVAKHRPPGSRSARDPARWAPRTRGPTDAAPPMIHESVFARIKTCADGYSPIVIPAEYRVTTRAGEVLSETFESDGQAVARARRQERAWNWVWLKRVVYFVTVLVSAMLAAAPALVLKWPGDGERSLAAPLIPVVDLIGGVLPGLASPWVDAFRQRPEWLLYGGVALGVLLYVGGRLQRRIFDVVRNIWRRSLAGGEAPEVPVPSDWLYRLRTSEAYIATFQMLRRWVLPVIALVVIVCGLGVGASRVLFAIGDSIGLVCPEPKGSAAERQTAEFDTKSLCHPTGFTVAKGQSYRLMLTVTRPFVDGHGPKEAGAANIATDPNGFGFEKMVWQQFLGLPLRRLIASNWFRVVARIGRHGLDEQPLDFEAAPDGRTFVTTFAARSDDELYLYVNDAVIALPGYVDWFYRHNNSGAAKVALEPVK
ncbi:DUF2235 domain-containing protein [Rhodoplanes sp. TEM]|uniref:DUF2235 domain-containing protein n=1 Tax=Rhodoplanes tepidamans TaxID=200616 RepID=A0ABT5JG80_RHOTP|nr:MULTISPECIES: DUF2235 domain-containing protein [Rhodoplanes]MDC7788579.1 DUF2235 domain-containing protein [Rhodoplanes tepidamans]MDC7986797.1 DUF2235 domain-containing protein [Rhodoplanes sp. TEM]MDQ0358561.1 uncharacterized protein (DUF2235 family) [Rhodoplanes tepidamans]